MATSHKFAAGHNNPGGLQRLDEISVPLFKDYKFDLKTEWHDEGSRRVAGDGDERSVGRPYVVVIFDVITLLERDLLRTALCPGNTALVTIQTLNKRVNGYLIYNGRMVWPKFDEEEYYLGAWRNVRLTIRDLRHYSAYSSGYDLRAYGV